jgi:hypothetical protein
MKRPAVSSSAPDGSRSGPCHDCTVDLVTPATAPTWSRARRATGSARRDCPEFARVLIGLTRGNADQHTSARHNRLLGIGTVIPNSG